LNEYGLHRTRKNEVEMKRRVEEGRKREEVRKRRVREKRQLTQVNDSKFVDSTTE